MRYAVKIAIVAYMGLCVGLGGFNRNFDTPVLQELDATGSIAIPNNASATLELISGLASLNPCLVPFFSFGAPAPAILLIEIASDVTVPHDLDVSLLRPPTI